jgi:hypothetical protein
MESLKTILEDARHDFTAGGPAIAPDLSVRLQTLRDQMWQTYKILFGAMIALIVVGIGGSAWLTLSGRISEVSGYVSALGISCASGAGTFGAARKVWVTWSRTTLLMILVENAPEDTVVSVIKTLSEKLSE